MNILIIWGIPKSSRSICYKILREGNKNALNKNLRIWLQLFVLERNARRELGNLKFWKVKVELSRDFNARIRGIPMKIARLTLVYDLL